MEQVVFKKFLHKYLKDHGFTKVKSKYYLKGNKFTCMIPDFRIQPQNVVLKRGLKDIVNIIISEIYITKFR